ncbi:TIR domain-containing protein [Actinoplanes sp. NPDC049802]|uniref:TIR domain-containing protein n=1 Tax=Actinoplanes sp. NPDC049802 TaxID=3154742 RepID=UPI0033EE6708
MSADFGPDVDSLVAAARHIAALDGHSPNSGHILLAMLADPVTPAGQKLTDSGLTEQMVRAGLPARSTRKGAGPGDSDDLTGSLDRAAKRAEDLGRRVAGWEDLLLSITDAGTEAARIITGAGLHLADVRDRALLTLNIPLPRRAGTVAGQRLPPPSAPAADPARPVDPDRSRRVFVIYGRDSDALRAVQDFIRDLGLLPVEFGEVEQLSNSAAPLVPNTVSQIFPYAQAVVALLTPDETVSLHADLRRGTDAPHDRETGCQSRPNVFFEIGMALGVKPDQTIIVQVGEVRPFSDIVGRSVLRLDSGDAKVLQTFKQRLSTAGCPVNDEGTDWLQTDRFTTLAATKRGPNGPRSFS